MTGPNKCDFKSNYSNILEFVLARLTVGSPSQGIASNK